MTDRSRVEPLSWTRLLILHLAPGALATLLYVVIADGVQTAGYNGIGTASLIMLIAGRLD